MGNEVHAFDPDQEPGCLTQGLLWLLAIGFFIYGLVGLCSGEFFLPWKSHEIRATGLGGRVAGVGLMIGSFAFVSAASTGLERGGCLKFGLWAAIVGGILIFIGVELS